MKKVNLGVEFIGRHETEKLEDLGDFSAVGFLFKSGKKASVLKFSKHEYICHYPTYVGDYNNKVVGKTIKHLVKKCEDLEKVYSFDTPEELIDWLNTK